MLDRLQELFQKIHTSAPTAGKPNYIIAGLGNPGLQYEQTRHNAGFMAVDVIAKHCGVSLTAVKFHSLYAQARLGDKNVLLLKPQTYMNNSGQAVCEAMDFYKIPPENTLIIFDDISLDVGKLRVRRRGSHGGHNGMKDIVQLSGSEDIPRIKIGIGKKPRPDYNLADWVLSKFTQPELELLQSLLKGIPQCAEFIASGKIDEAMNRYNS